MTKSLMAPPLGTFDGQRPCCLMWQQLDSALWQGAASKGLRDMMPDSTALAMSEALRLLARLWLLALPSLMSGMPECMTAQQWLLRPWAQWSWIAFSCANYRSIYK